ncbi:hypothetical protein EPO34_04275 [Patescibacteria group bacterium]|nr:MAG: hypothetical protein EPO34_04275 [Patescibacteria group bacterium]
MNGDTYQTQPAPSYAPAPAPTSYVEPPAPAPSRRPIVIGIAVGAVVLAIAVVAFVALRRGAGPTSAPVSPSQIEATSAECDAAKNPDGCRKVKLTELATNAASSDPCDALAGEARDSCLWSVAKEQGDPALCDGMVDPELRGTCADNVAFLMAVAAHDVARCEAIKGEGYRSSCVQQIEPTTSANCASRGGDAATCDGMKQTETAIAAGDPALCEQAGPDMDRCLDIVAETDGDHDGLTVLSERDYGTSPTKSDTDGDGFDDGDEVAAGYDPNGPGKL